MCPRAPRRTLQPRRGPPRRRRAAPTRCPCVGRIQGRQGLARCTRRAAEISIFNGSDLADDRGAAFPRVGVAAPGQDPRPHPRSRRVRPGGVRVPGERVARVVDQRAATCRHFFLLLLLPVRARHITVRGCVVLVQPHQMLPVDLLPASQADQVGGPDGQRVAGASRWKCRAAGSAGLPGGRP